MKRNKLVGTFLVALVALGAIFATGAFAKTAPITGPVAVTGSGGTSTLSSEGLPPISCAKNAATGALTSGKTDEDVVSFSTCQTEGKKCTTAGAAAGEIKTKLLKTEIGYVKGEEVGVDFSPKEGKYLAEFVCEGLPQIKVEGSVIGKVGPENTMSTTSEVVLKAKVTGKEQEIEKFETGSKDTLITTVEGLGAFPSTQENSDTVTNTPVSVTKGKKTTEEPDPSEISTKTYSCTTEEVEGKKGKKEKVESCTIVKRPAPEYGRCQASKTGHYTNSNCTEAEQPKKGKFKGKFEFEAV